MARHRFNVTPVSPALCVAGAIGCSELNTSTAPSPVNIHASPTASATPNIATPAEGTFPVSAELAAVRHATARFHSISEAYAAGYTTENEPCVAIPAGAMGVHAPNLPLILDPEIDPLRPELLLYIPLQTANYGSSAWSISRPSSCAMSKPGSAATHLNFQSLASGSKADFGLAFFEVGY